MKQIVLSANSSARAVEVPVPALKAGQVLIRTSFGAVSVGTERVAATHGKTSFIGKMKAHPDKVQQVLGLVRKNGLIDTYRRVTEILERWNATGYSCSGIVERLGDGVTGLHVGDLVACGGGYAAHAGYCVIPQRLLAKVPQGVPAEDAAFATIGAIAMQGVRQAEIAPGMNVAVVGLGLVGQLAAQIANAAGANVACFDPLPYRVEMAMKLGASSGFNLGSDDVLAKAMAFTGGRGFDSILLTAATSSNEPIKLGCGLARDRGRIVVVGSVGLDLDRQVMYDKELEIRLSRSYGPGRYDPSYEELGHDYPYGYVRWTEQRNIESVLQLMGRGKVAIQPLITHRFGIDEAEDAYNTVVKPQGAPPLGVVIRHDHDHGGVVPEPILRISKAARRPPEAGVQARIGIGFIGSGAFARSILLPILSKLPVDPVGIVSSTGIGPVQIGTRHGFEFAGTDPRSIFTDQRIQAAFIATRHSTHAGLVVAALEAGKSVFVEKPLATSLDDLRLVCEAQRRTGGMVMVGFNRRFAPMTRQICDFFGHELGPLVMSCRVNAGSADGHWSTSIAEGGRIVGEACHFVDLLVRISGSPVISVFARSTPAVEGKTEENICATLQFANGSIAALNYHGVGDQRIPKEYIEISGNGKCAILSDFTHLRLTGGRIDRTIKGRQDKGHAEELKQFVANAGSSRLPPIPFAQSVNATLATLALVESCRSGECVKIGRVEEDA